MDRIYRYLYHYLLKPLVFPHQPSSSDGNPLTAPRLLHTVWFKEEYNDLQFTSELEAWPDASHA